MTEALARTTEAGFAVSVAAFRRLWELCGLGETPVVLKLTTHAFTDEEQSAELARADAELGEQQLVRGGRPEADAEALLQILRRPAASTDARLWLDGSVRALAASEGPDGAMAVHAAGTVTVQPLDPGGLARAVVGLLPEHPPAPGSPAGIDRHDLDRAAEAAGSDTDRFASELRARQVQPRVAALFADAVADVVRRGQFGAAVIDKRGVRQYAREVVNFVDTSKGRFWLRDSGPPGDAHLTLTPISRDQLTAEVQTMLARLDPS